MTDFNFTEQEDAEFEAFINQAREEMVPKLMESAFGVTIVPVDPTELDMKFSLELGCMIMLDKPILAVVRPGTKVPERLVRVADEIIEVDLSDRTKTSKAVMEGLSRVAQRLGIDV